MTSPRNTCRSVYKLWEGSWEDGAVLRDRARPVFADPAKIHRVRHEGPLYRLDAIHLCEPSPQRTPVLYPGRRVEAAAAISPRAMPSACSSTARRPGSSRRRSPICAAAPPRMAAIPATC